MHFNNISEDCRIGRIDEIDFLKRVLILLMVLFHLPFNAEFQRLTEFVYSFHMQSFLLISGILATLDCNISKFGRKILYLVRVYFIFEVFYLLGVSLFGGIMGSCNQINISLDEYINRVFLHPVGTYWYLHSLIMCLIISYILNRIVPNRACATLIAAAATYFICRMFGITKWNEMAYFFVGVCMRDIVIKYKLFCNVRFSPALPVLVLLLIYFYGDFCSMGWIIVGVILLMLISFMRRIPNFILNHIKYVGRNSLSVVVFSPIFTVLVKKLCLFDSLLFVILWFISCIAIVYLCLVCAKCLDKLKITSIAFGREMYSPFSA